MRILAKIAAFLVIFGVVLSLKFPYDALVEKSVRRAEELTGATVLYRPVSAGPFGVKVSDLEVRLRSGASLRFDSARIFPTRQGLSATAYQEDNEMEVSLNLTQLELKLTDILVQSGSEAVGQARVTGDLTYVFNEQRGGGEMRLVVPELKLPLPVPDHVLEVGATYQIRNGQPDQSDPWLGVRAEVRLTGGQHYTGSGTVNLTPQPPNSPNVNGNINFEAPPHKGILRLSGTLDKLATNVIPR